MEQLRGRPAIEKVTADAGSPDLNLEDLWCAPQVVGQRRAAVVRAKIGHPPPTRRAPVGGGLPGETRQHRLVKDHFLTSCCNREFELR
jgi:hypothetical protein